VRRAVRLRLGEAGSVYIRLHCTRLHAPAGHAAPCPGMAVLSAHQLQAGPGKRPCPAAPQTRPVTCQGCIRTGFESLRDWNPNTARAWRRRGSTDSASHTIRSRRCATPYSAALCAAAARRAALVSSPSTAPHAAASCTALPPAPVNASTTSCPANRPAPPSTQKYFDTGYVSS